MHGEANLSKSFIPTIQSQPRLHPKSKQIPLSALVNPILLNVHVSRLPNRLIRDSQLHQSVETLHVYRNSDESSITSVF